MRTFLFNIKKRQQDQLTVAVTIIFLHYGKTTKLRESPVILIWCQALLFNLEFYLVMDFVSLCGSIKFNL